MKIKQKISRVLLATLLLSITGGWVPPVFAQSDTSVDVTATVLEPEPVDAPTILYFAPCTEGTSRTVSLSVQGGSANKEYFYEVSTDNFVTPPPVYTYGWTDEISHTFTGLTMGTTYFYYYRAKARDTNTLVESPYSNVMYSAQQTSCGGGGGGGTTYTCTDTDGLNYNLQGTVTITPGSSYTDSCTGDMLTEYYCVSSSASSPSTDSFICPTGCVNGACVSLGNTNTNGTSNGNANGTPSNTNTNTYNTNTNGTTNGNANGVGNGNENASGQNQNMNGTSNANESVNEVVAISLGTVPNTITNNPAITLSTAAKNAITMCFWGDIGPGLTAENPLCLPYANSTDSTLTIGDGVKNIYVNFRNGSITSETKSASIILDTTPPLPPEFSIPPETESRFITLTLTIPSDADWVQITSEKIPSDVLNTEYTYKWVSLQSSYPITLVGTYGSKSVTVQLKDRAGNVSPFVTHDTNFTEPYIPPENGNINGTTNGNQNGTTNHNTNQQTGANGNENSGQTNGNQATGENGNVNSTPSNGNINGGANGNFNGQNGNANHGTANGNMNGSGLPANGDADGDRIPNGEEQDYGTDPLNPDTDGDGLWDGEEVYDEHTDPLNPDSDSDLLNDGKEVKTYDTNPLKPDTDGDTCKDGAEVSQGTDPLDPTSQQCKEIPPELTTDVIQPTTPGINDTDGDGLSDKVEQEIGTDIHKTDTDGDGFTDGDEYLLYGTNPLDPEDNPNKRTNLRITNWKNQDIMTGVDWLIKGTCTPPSTIRVIVVDKDKKETVLGETPCREEKLFLLSASKEFEDGYFTIVARSYDASNTMLEQSPGISIMIDKTKGIDPPQAEMVDTVSIKEYVPPYLEANIVIHNKKPTVYGKTLYGSNVQATFESVITSSSIIADSIAGDFAISSPNPLDIGKHQVILYATTPEGLRSSTLTIPFMITEMGEASSSFPWWWILILLLIISTGLTYWYYESEKKKGKKKSA